MLNSTRAHAIYLEEYEARDLLKQLRILYVRAKIESVKVLVTDFRAVSDLENTLRDITTHEVEGST
jgi:hypothetical protein